MSSSVGRRADTDDDDTDDDSVTSKGTCVLGVSDVHGCAPYVSRRASGGGGSGEEKNRER